MPATQPIKRFFEIGFCGIAAALAANKIFYNRNFFMDEIINKPEFNMF